MIGAFTGLFFIMFTKRKWLWTGLFNVFAGLAAFSAWWIPVDGKFVMNWCVIKWFQFLILQLQGLIGLLF